MDLKSEIISSLTDQRIEIFKSLKLNNIPDDVYLVEGKETVRQALISKDTVLQLFLDVESKADWENFLNEFSDSKKDQPEIVFADKSLMSEVVGYHLHQGFLGKVRRPKLKLADCKIIFPIIALNNVEKAENVGAIIRTAICYGIRTILIDKGTCSPYLRRAVRVSMGAVCHCEVFEVESLISEISKIRSNTPDVQIVSLEQGKTSIDYREVNYIKKSILILGSESRGVSLELLELSNAIVNIPIDTKFIKSLNVSVATGIMLAELNKSR